MSNETGQNLTEEEQGIEDSIDFDSLRETPKEEKKEAKDAWEKFQKWQEDGDPEACINEALKEALDSDIDPQKVSIQALLTHSFFAGFTAAVACSTGRFRKCLEAEGEECEPENVAEFKQEENQTEEEE